MSYYQQYTGRILPQNTLLIPLQYLAFGSQHHVVILASIEKDIGKGTSKNVQEAVVKDIIGRPPLQEIASLRGRKIALYRPREEFHIFVNDILAIVKLGQMQIKAYNARANLVKIRGHSLYISEDYIGTEQDYSRLLYEGYLNLKLDPNQLLKILQSALLSTVPPDSVSVIAQEILNNNDLINTPFMIADILQYSLPEGFQKTDKGNILQNLYQMVYTVASYASEGVYFRDLQPDNFRFNEKFQVKLIDPSYIDESVPLESRYALFIKQTTPEYLPSVFSVLLRNNDQKKIVQYFGDFTQGVCIGMLERVIKRVFLPKYMGEKYDSLYLYNDPSARIEKVLQLQFQEDVDLFRDIVQGYPTQQNFQQYEESLSILMRKEGMPYEIVLKVPALLTALRRFSYPVFTPQGCQSLLMDKKCMPVMIGELSTYVSSLLEVAPNYEAKSSTTSVYTKESTLVPGTKPKSIGQEKISPIGILQSTNIMNPTLIRPRDTQRRMTPMEKAPWMTEASVPTTPKDFPPEPLSRSGASLSDIEELTKEEIEAMVAKPKEGTSRRELESIKARETAILGNPPTAPLLSIPQSPYLRGKDTKTMHLFPPLPIAKIRHMPTKQEPGVEFPTQAPPFPPEPPALTTTRIFKMPPSESLKGKTTTPFLPSHFPPLSERLEMRKKEPSFEAEMMKKKDTPSSLPTTSQAFVSFTDEKKGNKVSIGEETPPAILSMLSHETKVRRQENKILYSKEMVQKTEKAPILDRQTLTKKMLRPDLSDIATTPITTPEPAASVARYSSVKAAQKYETRRFEKTVRQLFEFIKKELATIKNVMDENPAFEERFRQRILEILCSGTAYGCVEDFLCNSNAFLQNLDEQFDLLRYAQNLVPSDIVILLEKIAAPEIKRHFQPGPIMAGKCKKILCRYLVRIVKTRFLITADRMLDIYKMFPQKDENMIEFICKYDLRNCFTSIGELPFAILKDIAASSGQGR